MTTPRKERKREARREQKAEQAAVLDKSIEKELLERLKRGVYPGEIVNIIPVAKYNEILDKEAIAEEEDEDEEEHEIEYVEGYEELEEEDDMEDFGGLAIENAGAADDDDEVDSDDEETVVIHRKRNKKESGLGSRKHGRDEPSVKAKKKAKVLVEVEHEDGSERQTAVQ
nr:protein MAK16 homolog [Ipomoea batatas]